jgi:hypothetical protein
MMPNDTNVAGPPKPCHKIKLSTEEYELGAKTDSATAGRPARTG